MLSVQPPHSPYVPPVEGARYHSPAEIEFRPNVPVSRRVRSKAALDLAGYYGMIENLDLNVGRIREALKRLDVDREARSRAAEPDSAHLQQVPRKFHPHSVNRAWRGIVTRDGWKYVCMPGHEWLLFDLNDDPYEMTNLAYDVVFQPQKERCHALLAQWIERTGDSFTLSDISLGDS